MQEDESQPEPEKEPPSEDGSEESQPVPEPQPPSKQAGESKFEQEKQPPSERRADENQPEQEKHPPSERERGWSEYEWNRYKGETEGSEYEPQQPSSEKERVESQPRPQQQSPSERGVDQIRPRQRLQPPPAAPIPLPPPVGQKTWQYLLGLGLGLIPVIIFFINNYSLFFLACTFFLVEMILMAIFLANRSVRFVGYGLLTAILITPIVVAIGCSVFRGPVL